MSARDLAQAVVAALLGAEVTDVVACPGSRNSPLLLAFAAADQHGQLRLHMRIDERGAGFLALGIAKATGRPAAVCTTSGTAVGNLLPVAMEARHSGGPLVLLAADRPATMRGTGASQTTWQPGLFAPAAETIELSDRRPDEWAGGLIRALGTATSGVPVHVNLEFDAPLVEPLDAYSPVTPTVGTPAADAPEPLTVPARSGTILLLGDASPDRGRRAALDAFAAGVPVFAEPSSNGRIPGALQAPDLLLRTALAHEITHVVVVGRPTLSRPQRALLTSPDIRVTQVAQPWCADRYPAAREVAREIRWADADPDAADWLARWRGLDDALRPLVDDLAAEQPLNGWGLTYAVLAHLTGADAVVWGSSQLIRDADLAPIAPHPPPAYAMRGLAGIDGTISFASGIALGSGRPTTAVVGDLTALHDISALAVPTLEEEPRLRIVVGHDDGGVIFTTLEQGELDDAVFDRVFGVPHGRSLARIAEGFGVRASQVDNATDLDAALARPIDGLEVVEVRLDRTRRRDQVARLRRAASGIDV